MEFSPEERDLILRALINNYVETESDLKNNVAENLIQKIIHLDQEYASTILVNENLAKPINEPIFLGNGIYSKLAENNLHKRLAYALEELSGMQQNGGMGFEFDQESFEQSRENIINVIKDIIVAFQGELYNKKGI